MTDPSPFRLDYRSTNGQVIGRLAEDDGGNDLFEYTTWLRVRSDVPGYVAPTTAPEDDEVTGFVPPVFMTDGLAVLIVARSHQDFGGESIGMFRHGVDTEQLERIRRLVELMPWSEMPPPVGGDFAAPQFELSYSSGNLLIQREYNAGCGLFREVVCLLEDALDELASTLMTHPMGVLDLEVWAERGEQEGSSDWATYIKLTNRGVGSIVLTDPRVPPSAEDRHVLDDQPRLELRIGEFASAAGVPPHEWTNLPLPPLPEDAPRSLVLAAGNSFELSIPWSVPRPGKFLLAGRWQDYGGPVEPVAQQLPFMPLPGRGASAPIRGPYPVRGAAFANRLIEVPAEAKPRTR